ncbi:MAG: divalent-cation tolerance protein CutA [Bryobacteraceae bacterium]|nr:divalent-cation tolerance protein CutA [Bryobacteraceae bacterium]
MTDSILVLCTCGSEEEAGKIARALVTNRLAACVNILAPVRSIYRWKGAIEEATEWQLFIKTRRELLERIGNRIRLLHSYDTPEMLAIPVVDGLADYLHWIASETGGQEDTE